MNIKHYDRDWRAGETVEVGHLLGYFLVKATEEQSKEFFAALESGEPIFGMVYAARPFKI